MKSLLLQTACRIVIPLQILLSLYLLFRGHHLPGGGFIGGLIAASSTALHATAYGMNRTVACLHLPPKFFAGLGILTALLSGLISSFTGEAFQKGLWWSLGSIEFGTPLLFDLGIYLLVFGSAVQILMSLGKETDLDETTTERGPT
jgi:multicomponent Na+:H+ antiporter subunit B